MMKTKNNDVGLMIQFILMFWIFVFSIVALFEKSFFIAMELIISLTLFVMAYNNQKTFKRKNLTAVYIICALFIIMSLFIKL